MEADRLFVCIHRKYGVGTNSAMRSVSIVASENIAISEASFEFHSENIGTNQGTNSNADVFVFVSMLLVSYCVNVKRQFNCNIRVIKETQMNENYYICIEL